MSFEPETNDTIIRQLREEIARIREEQFAIALPTNEIASSSAFGGSSGTALPNIGTSASPPQRINATVDTGVIDKLDYKALFTNKDFAIGEIITGATSGATAKIGDIDILVAGSTGTLILVPSSITGVFQDNEIIDGDINGRARVDGILFTQVGRGHLNARATTIIAQGLTSTFELHFLDGAIANGQQIWLRPANGQTMVIRRPVTTDGNTGNIDFNETVSIGENQLILLQFHTESNVTPNGGWIPVSNVSGGVASGNFGLPIIYDVDDKGDLNGLISVSIDLSTTTAHVTEVRLIEDVANPGVSISQTIGIIGAPADNKGILFFLRVEQDSLGGHTIVLPATVFPVPTIDTAPNSISTIMLFTSDNGISFQSLRVIEGGGGGDNLGNHMATMDLDMKTFNIINTDVYKYAKGIEPGADSIIGFTEYGSAVENDTKLKWSIPASGVGQPRFYEWQVDLAPIMRLERPFGSLTRLDMLQGSVQNTTGITFSHLPLPALSAIRPQGLEMVYETGFGSGQGAFHGFRVGFPTFPQFEIREDVLRSNVNIDMITNNIFDVDVVEWASTGGFLAGTNHGIRSIGGGNTGLEMNVPFTKSYRLFFENLALDDSNLEYEFFSDKLDMKGNNIDDVTAIFFPNGGSIADILSEIVFSGGVPPPLGSPPQTIKFRVQEQTGPTTYEVRDIFELVGDEFFAGGGMKMFTDLNMQTQNINNIDVLKFVPDGGVIVGTEYAMGADFSDTGFNFNVPLNRDYVFNNNAIPIAVLDPTGLQLFANPSFLNPQMGAREFALTGLHTDGIVGMLDGSFRLVDNAGSSDVMVATGGSIINLSTIGTSFIGFTADADLDMGTFNIFNMDVLRYAVDGGVIGFGEYGSAVEAGGSKLKWSVPTGKFYEWQINLDRVADMNTASFHMRSNVQTTHPSIITDGAFLFGVTHTSGTAGMLDGESRLVNVAGSQDVIFGSGGKLVNLTTIEGIQPGDDIIWTGDHTFDGLVFTINSQTIFIGDTDNDNVFIRARINSDLIPDDDNFWDIGTADLGWKDIRLKGQIRVDTGINSSLMDAFRVITPTLQCDNARITGDIIHGNGTNDNIGFFNTPVVSQQSVVGPADPENATSINSIIALLKAYGLAS